MIPSRGDGLLRTAELARALGIDPSTVSKWRERGHITPDGLDEHGRPLYRLDTGREAARLVTQNGLLASGVDPRSLRGRSRAGKPPAPFTPDCQREAS